MLLFSNLFKKPSTITLLVSSSNGFHLRPAAQLVAHAKKYNSRIEASFGTKRVDAKVLNSLLSLNLSQGDTFTLSSKDKEALESLEKLFISIMSKDKDIEVIEEEKQSFYAKTIKGEILVKGVAIAPLHPYHLEEKYGQNSLSFQDALQMALEELDTLQKEAKHEDESSIFMAQKELLISITKQVGSLKIFEERIAREIASLQGGVMETKIADYKDLHKRIKRHLGYSYNLVLPSHPFILLASDLLPTDIQSLQNSQVEGIVLQNTTPSSHTAILLRASAITSIIVNQEVISPSDSKNVILDATAGAILLKPDEKDIDSAKKRQSSQKKIKQHLYEKRFYKAKTSQGVEINVFANVTDVASAKLAKEEGAEGIGLLRTEFLFTSRQPTLKAQTSAYKQIFSLFSNITVRTLDIGGDKALPYVKLPHENNPFLGIRGIRLLQTHPEIIEEQLHAIFLASKERSIKIMFPMIATVEEFTKAKKFAYSVAKKHKLQIEHIQFGIMIEVPSVLFLLPEFDKVVDFYSIGTNDLTQYLFAMERTHPTLRVDALSPVVFAAIQSIMEQCSKPVSICGELAGEIDAIKPLIQLGVKTLSISPKLTAQTKEEIRNV